MSEHQRADDTHGLVLAAHGSHDDPASSAPVFAHADRLRELGVFDEVRAAFWQGEPHLREVLQTVTTDRVTIVPLLMADGYFADDVFPRELRLESDQALATSKTVRYTAPVGTHPSLVNAINRLATDTAGDAACGLAIVGHGTARHDESGTSTREHVERLRSQDRFSEVDAFFLDQAPTVETLTSSMQSRDIVIVPLFVANGTHTTEDIPRAIGLPPHPSGITAVDDKRLWYTKALGTEPAIADVILERGTAESVQIVTHGSDESGVAGESATERFGRWLGMAVTGDKGHKSWGDLRISVRTSADAPHYSVRHQRDVGRPTQTLDHLEDIPAVRERVRYDDNGAYRPLTGAQTLPTGWISVTNSRAKLVRLIETVYPGSIYAWHRATEGHLDLTNFDAAMRRHTGRFGELDDISPEIKRRAIESCCDNCVRHPAWTADAVAESDQNIPCREPCSFLLDCMVDTQQ